MVKEMFSSETTDDQGSQNKKKKRKSNRFVLMLREHNISRRDYWIEKLKLAIKQKVDVFVNVRVQPHKSEYILEEMEKHAFDTPSELINAMIDFNRKGLTREIKVLRKYYNVNSNQELFEKFVEMAYSNLVNKVKDFQELNKKEK